MRTFPQIKNITFNSTQVLLVGIAAISLFFNLPFLERVYHIVPLDSVGNWMFLLSVPVLLMCLTVVFITLIGGLFFTRTIVAVLVVLSGILYYATAQYGIIFDKSMIQNIVETSSGEAFSYLNLKLAIFMGALIGAAAFLIARKKSRHMMARLRVNVMILGVALLGTVAIAGGFYQNYASVGRNHHDLVKYLIPFSFVDATVKFARDTYFYPPLAFRTLDAHPVALASNQTVVMIVGETARADRFSVNGYAKQTNPELESLDIQTFANVSSCGTATAVSVPCMFSRQNREEYDSRMAESQDNVLDLVQRAGVNVTWIDNNSTCKGVCKRVPTQEFEPEQANALCDGEFCFDDILLEKLHAELAKPVEGSRLIVLHMIGSHGPTYYRRYPDAYRKFTPDCPTSDIQNCSEQALQNTYDNTIVYTDHIISQVINTLSGYQDATMLYVSDHGESLGESGLYLHGFPYQLAPAEQTHVPMIVWQSDFDQPAYRDCIAQLSGENISHDNIFDSLMGLAKVDSTVYQPAKDIFKRCEALKHAG